MPRDSSGNYTLPAGNPVITGTLIESTWANPTMEDIGQALSDSLDRFGRGTMLAPLPFVNGSVSQPSITWGTEPSMGLYRASNQDMRLVVAGVDRMRWRASPARPQIFDTGIWKDIALGGDLPSGVLTDTGDFTISGVWVFDGATTRPRFNQGIQVANNAFIYGRNAADAVQIALLGTTPTNVITLGDVGYITNLTNNGDLRFNNALINAPNGLVKVAGDGFIPNSLINLTSGLTFIGPWDASTGQNPTEAGEGPFTGGEWYNIEVAGTINLINPGTGLEVPTLVEVGNAIVYGTSPAGWYKLSFGSTPPPDLSTYTQRTVAETISAAWSFAPTVTRFYNTAGSRVLIGNEAASSGEQRVSLVNLAKTVDFTLANTGANYGIFDRTLSQWALELTDTTATFGNRTVSGAVATAGGDFVTLGQLTGQTISVGGVWTFNAGLKVPNAQYFKGTLLDGSTILNLIGIDTSDRVAVGNTTTPLNLRTNGDLRLDNQLLNQPLGLAQVGTGGKLPVSLFPFSALTFKGTWSAAGGTNPPNGVTAGEFYVINVAGTLTVFIDNSGIPVAQAVEPGDYLLWLTTPNAPATGWYWLRREAPAFVAAEDVTYDNSTSAWTGTIVQDVLDEISDRATLRDTDVTISASWTWNGAAGRTQFFPSSSNTSGLVLGGLQVTDLDLDTAAFFSQSRSGFIASGFQPLNSPPSGSGNYVSGLHIGHRASGTGLYYWQMVNKAQTITGPGSIQSPRLQARYSADGNASAWVDILDTGSGARTINATWTLTEALSISRSGGQLKLYDTDDGDNRNNLVFRNGEAFKLSYQDNASVFTNFLEYTDVGTLTLSPGAVPALSMTPTAVSASLPWTFSGAARFNAPVELANAVSLLGRNSADTVSFPMVTLSASSQITIGGTTAGLSSTQYVVPSGFSHQFFAGGAELARIVARQSGGVLVTDRNQLLRKAGFRNPKRILVTANRSFSQDDEGAVVRVNGDNIQMTVDILEVETTINFQVPLGTGCTIVDGTAAMRILNGTGSPGLGPINIARGSVVTLWWDQVGTVHVWGNGIS